MGYDAVTMSNKPNKDQKPEQPEPSKTSPKEQEEDTRPQALPKSQPSTTNMMGLDIPNQVIAAANLLHSWATQTMGFNWQLMNICDRNFATENDLFRKQAAQMTQLFRSERENTNRLKEALKKAQEELRAANIKLDFIQGDKKDGEQQSSKKQ